MGAVEQVERQQRRRGLVIGVAIAAVLVVLALLTSGGGTPAQQLRAEGAATTAVRGSPVTRAGATPTPS